MSAVIPSGDETLQKSVWRVVKASQDFCLMHDSSLRHTKERIGFGHGLWHVVNGVVGKIQRDHVRQSEQRRKTGQKEQG